MSVNQKKKKGAESLQTFTYTEQTQGLQRHGSVAMKVCIPLSIRLTRHDDVLGPSSHVVATNDLTYFFHTTGKTRRCSWPLLALASNVVATNDLTQAWVCDHESLHSIKQSRGTFLHSFGSLVLLLSSS